LGVLFYFLEIDRQEKRLSTFFMLDYLLKNIVNACPMYE